MKYEFAGYFKLDVHSVDPEGNAIPGSQRGTGWFRNLIVNNGLDLLGTGGDFLNRCFIGTSNTPPANTNTALGAQVAFANGSITSTPVGSDYISAVCTYTFAKGAAVGNMQEIGIGTTGNSLFSRALIVDSGGSPTVLVLTSIDILTVTYQLRCYRSQADDVSVVSDGATNYTVTTRTANGLGADALEQWVANGPWSSGTAAYPTVMAAGALGAWTSAPTGTGYNNSGNFVVAPYSPGSYSLTGVSNFAVGQGNVPGGVGRAVIFNSPGSVANSLQASISPVIQKNNTKTLALTWTISWARRP